MQGEQLGEERGKITGRRVLPADGQGVKMEVTFQAKGKALGIDTTGFGTYWSVMQPNGFLYGEGQGILVTATGETAQWTGVGRGQLKKEGGASFRGAIFYQTNSQSLARLNGVAVIFEHEADAEDNIHTRTWEWK